ncbi:MAG: rhamnogalacturonan acetylesterase [Chthoniobacterales bacterium]
MIKHLSIRSIIAALAALFIISSAKADMPTLWLIGDSTVQVGTRGQQGWGTALPQFFNTEKIKIENRARGGRSSRTFLTEGLWEKVREQIKPGDYLMMQFGHNDASPINEDPPVTRSTRARGTIRNNSDETKDIINVLTGKRETVHSYGWYLKQFVTEGKAAGAQVIVISPIPKRGFVNGSARRGGGGYASLAKEVAEQNQVNFIDLSSLVADKYNEMGEAASKALFNDSVHTTPEGAKLNASCVVEGIRSLSDCNLKNYLLETK